MTRHEAVLVNIALEQVRRDERAKIVAELRAQAAHMEGEVGDQRRRGAINHAADRVRDRRGPGRPEDMLGVPRG